MAAASKGRWPGTGQGDSSNRVELFSPSMMLRRCWGWPASLASHTKPDGYGNNYVFVSSMAWHGTLSLGSR